MRDRLGELLRMLEHELRLQRRWDDQPPPDAALRSEQPFAVDTLSFDQWLQWKLLPQMHEHLSQQLPLPTNCAIAPMAEEFYGNHVGGMRITRIVAEIDRLLTDSKAHLN